MFISLLYYVYFSGLSHCSKVFLKKKFLGDLRIALILALDLSLVLSIFAHHLSLIF